MLAAVVDGARTRPQTTDVGGRTAFAAVGLMMTVDCVGRITMLPTAGTGIGLVTTAAFMRLFAGEMIVRPATVPACC